METSFTVWVVGNQIVIDSLLLSRLTKWTHCPVLKFSMCIRRDCECDKPCEHAQIGKSRVLLTSFSCSQRTERAPSFPADPGQMPNAPPVGWLQCSPTMIPGSAGRLGSAAFEPGLALSKPNSVAEDGKGHSAETKQGRGGHLGVGEQAKATDASTSFPLGGGVHFG